MITFILKYKKIIGGLTALLTLLVLWNQVHDHIYKKGVLDERIRLQAEFNKAFEAQRKEYEIQLQNRLQTLSEDYEDQLRIERERVKIEYITKEVIEYVDREIEIPVGCDDLANNVVRVLQQATRITSTAADTSSRSSNQ